MTPALAFQGVIKRYGRRTALDGLSLSLPTGCLCGLIGSNGAGKTTALAIAAGLVRPDAGTVDLLGLGPFDPSRHAGRLSLLPQDAAFPPESTARELMTYFAQLQELPARDAASAVARSLARVHLETRADDPVRTLSHGMKRRLAIAQSFLGTPKLVLLDEPMNGLDPREAAGARDLLRSWRGRQTVVISSHNLGELEQLCDEVVFLENGRALQAGPMPIIAGHRQVIRYELDGAPVPLAALEAGVPGAAFTLSDDRRQLRCRFDPDRLTVPDVNRRVLNLLLAAGTGLVNIRCGDGLEAVYLERTGTA